VIARLRGFAVTAAIVAATGGAIAAADPDPASVHVLAEHCPDLDPVVLDAAVTQALALDPRMVAIAVRVIVWLDCGDALHARVRVERGLGDPPLERELDLGEEPPELRIKLVALVVAELIDALASTPETAAMAPPPTSPVTAPVIAPGPGSSAGASTAKRVPAITLRAGVRMFADDQAPMATFSADLDVGPLQLGLATAIGDDNGLVGTSYIIAVAASRRLVCTRGGTTLCLVGRGEAGFSGVSIRTTSVDAMPRSVHSGYGHLGLGFEVDRSFGAWSALADVDVGYADGLVMETQVLAHLDGPFAVAGLGVRW
jgi:hypothetical protein